MMYCLSRCKRRWGFILRMPLNQGSSRHSHSLGDMMFARTRLYINSGKTKISMSDNVTAAVRLSISRSVIMTPQRSSFFPINSSANVRPASVKPPFSTSGAPAPAV